MSIIRSHTITLTSPSGIFLRPLCDDHLPLLYRWNSDPEVLYWTEGVDDPDLSYSPEVVHRIYGGISHQGNLCFAIEADGQFIGECWLQQMNLPQVSALHPADTDVRRIDMCIGEKSLWGRGIGTIAMALLVEFAFSQEGVDVLHCINDDYNIRSRRMMEKNGFTLIQSIPLPSSKIGNYELHWQLTKEQYFAL